jgi:sugar lactone lactonase YvrE
MLGRAGFLLGVCLPLFAFDSNWIEEYAKEGPAASKACAAKEYAECRAHLTRLLEILDGRVDIVYRLAKVEAQLGNNPAALQWLGVYSKTGLRLADPESDPAFAALKENPEFQAILKRIQSASQPISKSRPFLTLPEKDLISEDIAHDTKSGRFFVSSVRHRKILAEHRGKFTDFVSEGKDPNIWGILALRVDEKRRLLWASTAAMPESIGYDKAIEGKSALLKYSVDSGALVKRYDVQESGKHALGDMVLSRAGGAYASDGFGAVYTVRHNRDALEVLIGPGTFRSPQTPALSPDEKRLFVPDYTRGIGIVDLATKQVKLLQHPRDLSLGGIDGLYLAGRWLIAVQNGTAPSRIIGMKLDESLTRVVSWETLESNSPGFGAPTHGVVVGRQFYYIADSGWDKMADDGSVKPGTSFDAPTIRVMVVGGTGHSTPE